MTRFFSILACKKTRLFNLVFLFLVFLALILDRFLKFLALNNFFNPPIKIISDWLRLNFQANPGVAFSLPLGGAWLNLIIVLIIISLIAHLAQNLKNNNFAYLSFVLLIILGAFSNLLDRVKYGYVIDYLDLKYFSVFNLADVMIFLGVAGLIYSIDYAKVKE